MKKSLGVGRAARAGHAGFTLIELLTVIAIISVLAGLTAVAVPRYLENAREVQATTNAAAVAQAIKAKSAEVGNTGGYLPAYGFILPAARELTPADMAAAPEIDKVFMTRPYTAEIGLHGADASFEIARWTQAAHDSNNDGTLGLLEYCPAGVLNTASNIYEFTTELYAGPSGEFSLGVANPQVGAISEISLQTRTGEPRPLAYVPFNSRQLNTIRKYWLENGDEFGENIDFDDSDLAGRMFFPPPSYDGFVLVGNGPGGDNGGVVASMPSVVGSTYDPVYAYHVAALRTAFLATRDKDGDRLKDFDYRDRKQNGTHLLPPDAKDRNSYGAFITVSE